MERKARILFISLTLLALTSSAVYHNFLAPSKTELTIEGTDEIACLIYDQEWEEKFGGGKEGLITYYVEKYKLYRKMGKFGKYFRRKKKSK